MAKLLPILLLILGVGGGYGPGLMFKPEPAEKAACDGADCPEDHAASDGGDGGDGHGADGGHGEKSAGGDGHGGDDAGLDDDHGDDGTAKEYVKLADQFVIPVLDGGKAASIVVISLTLEVEEGTTQDIYAIEPRLRDRVLTVLFDHANSGGFDGRYTETRRLDGLRRALLEVSRSTAGTSIKDILITDIVRQES